MTRGRPPMGPELVDNRDGSKDAKKRLELILQTIAGKKTVEEACAALDIQAAAFHKLRTQVLQAALEECEPKAAGRPAQLVTEEAKKVVKLEAEVRDLHFHLRAAQARAELAVAMPGVLKPLDEEALKKTAQFVRGPARAGGRPGSPSSGGKPGT